MSFMKVDIRQQVEGNPGFIKETMEVQINTQTITLFNSGEAKDETFVRLTCGTTLCVAMPYSSFVKKMQIALRADKKVSE